MPKQTISYLKSLFVTGARPLQQWWHDVFDSFVHKDDLAAVNQSVVNTTLNTYDSGLRAITNDGVVNTLGDVFKVFQNYSDARNINNELQWPNLPGRPNQIILSGSAMQRIAFSNINTSGWPATGGTSFTRIRSLKGLAGISESIPIAIVDMQFIRHQLTNTESQTITIETISSIDILLNPRVSLS